jgi:UDP-N-acetylmuramoylalanine--D-glutamate ligase
VAELSSFQLETAYTFRPRVSAVLKIAPDHLNRHKTLENYIAAQRKIFANQTPADFLVLNYDDPACRAMEADARCRVVYFSRTEALSEGVYLDGDMVQYRFNGEHGPLLKANDLNILLDNALAGIAIALCAGAPVQVIRETVLNFKAIEHRIEYVKEIKGIKFYNDSKATNTDAAMKALEAMKGPVVLIGGGYDKGEDFSEWIKSFGGRVKYMVVMGATADKIIETLKQYGFTSYMRVNSLRDAVLTAHGQAQRGDCVLLSPACASWDMFDNYEQRGKLFKEYVAELVQY